MFSFLQLIQNKFLYEQHLLHIIVSDVLMQCDLQKMYQRPISYFLLTSSKHELSTHLS
jgi:hypothetical protein